MSNNRGGDKSDGDDKGSNNDEKKDSDFCLPVHHLDSPEVEHEGCNNSSHVHKL